MVFSDPESSFGIFWTWTKEYIYVLCDIGMDFEKNGINLYI